MAVNISGKYLGEKRVEMEHGPSKSLITSDAPLDNSGLGRNFSPTDLVAAALGSCVITTIAIVAERNGISILGAYFAIEKIMQDSPRRIARLPLVIHLPKSIAEHERPRIERAGLGCPVHQSLHPDVQAQISFKYDV